MNRLQSELGRLYPPTEPGGRVRAMVLELTGPPSWELLSAVWLGVQTELDLPAPAVAVNGIDGLQLWFSLAEPVAVSQAQVFLESLRTRFLPEVEPGRLRLLPARNASGLAQANRASPVPAQQGQTGRWSAFVAADLAPVFAETPWLEGPPNEEGQATLLRSLQPMKPAAFADALKRLQPGTADVSVEAPRTQAQAVAAAADEDPESFLRRVMNDDSVALALRIEAARALLQHAVDARRQPGD